MNFFHEIYRFLTQKYDFKHNSMHTFYINTSKKITFIVTSMLYFHNYDTRICSVNELILKKKMRVPSSIFRIIFCKALLCLTKQNDDFENN